MVRFILYIIATYIVAKLIGVVLRLVRRLFGPSQQTRKPTSRNTGVKSPAPYLNVEDVEYEDITDKK